MSYDIMLGVNVAETGNLFAEIGESEFFDLFSADE